MNLPRRTFYLIDRYTKWVNNLIIVIAITLAFLWIILGKNELEAWLALLGLVSIFLSKIPTILEKVGYQKYPLGEGVISKGGCWLLEGEIEHNIFLKKHIDRLSTKIDYIPTDKVMAHIHGQNLVFKRREGEPLTSLRVDYELIKK